jgi:hypothetical protein
LDNSLQVYESGFFDVAKATFHSGLRPVSADDIPIIGKLKMFQIKKILFSPENYFSF